jgi:hypothetical protein
MKFSVLNYTVKFIFSFILGIVLYVAFENLIPLSINTYVTSLFISFEIPSNAVKFIYEIIVNSVDIFKILFIIMLSGITYISNIVSGFGIVLAGVFYGFSACVCISDIVSSSLYCDHKFIIAVLVLKIIILSLLVIYSCVMSAKIGYDIKYFDDSCLAKKSDLFIKYLFHILVILGCVIILEVIFRFILKFLI